MADKALPVLAAHFPLDLLSSHTPLFSASRATLALLLLPRTAQHTSALGPFLVLSLPESTFPQMILIPCSLSSFSSYLNAIFLAKPFLITPYKIVTYQPSLITFPLPNLLFSTWYTLYLLVYYHTLETETEKISNNVIVQCFQGYNEVCYSHTSFLGLYIDIIPLKSNLAVYIKSHKMLMSWNILCFENSENQF